MGKTILAVDPGTHLSGFVVYRDGELLGFDKWANDSLVEMIRDRNTEMFLGVDEVVIEALASYGMRVGGDVLETAYFSGELAEVCRGRGWPVRRILRRHVKQHVCGKGKANDAKVRAAMISAYGGNPASRRKADMPVRLRGVTADVWQALALAKTAAETEHNYKLAA